MFSKLVQIELEKKDDIIHLEGFSDIHMGGTNHLPKLFERRMKAVMDDPNRFTFYGGDMLDAITPKDKRWQEESVTINSLVGQKRAFYDATKDLTDLHKKLKKKSKHNTGKILWGLAGNHEYNNKEIDQTWIRDFLDPLDVDYLGSRAIVGFQINWKGKPLRRWKILTTHGFGSSVNVEKPLQDMKVNHYCDVFLMGHLHQKLSKDEYVIDFSFDEGKWVQRKIVLGNTGSFCQTLVDGEDQWFERRNKLVPTSPGTITISFDAYKGDMKHHG